MTFLEARDIEGTSRISTGNAPDDEILCGGLLFKAGIAFSGMFVITSQYGNPPWILFISHFWSTHLDQPLITLHNPTMSRPQPVIPVEVIASRIYLIRGEKVMLDSDLADLYGVETGALVRAVKRNIKRFPEDFAFQLSDPEFENLRCQFGTSKTWGGRRYAPHAFTEQGVAMLSSVLRSDRAAEVNVAIIRTFVKLREILATHKDLARKVEEHDRQIGALLNAVQKLLAAPDPAKKHPIGYIHPKD